MSVISLTELLVVNIITESLGSIESLPVGMKTTPFLIIQAIK